MKNKNKSHERNVQRLWDTMKRPKFLIIGIDEREESQISGIDQLFNKITDESVPKSRKDKPS